MKFVKFLKALIPYVCIAVVVVLIRFFVISPVMVRGTSMSPTLNNGQILILNIFDKKFDRFDVVVFKYNHEKLIKRVIGLPGEHIEFKNSKLYVNGNQVDEKMISATTPDFKLEDIGYSVIPKGYYFVMGDNRNNSKDSRIIGLIPKKTILGTVGLSIFPFNKIGFVK